MTERQCLEWVFIGDIGGYVCAYKYAYSGLRPVVCLGSGIKVNAEDAE